MKTYEELSNFELLDRLKITENMSKKHLQRALIGLSVFVVFSILSGLSIMISEHDAIKISGLELILVGLSLLAISYSLKEFCLEREILFKNKDIELTKHVLLNRITNRA